MQFSKIKCDKKDPPQDQWHMYAKTDKKRFRLLNIVPLFMFFYSHVVNKLMSRQTALQRPDTTANVILKYFFIHVLTILMKAF